MSGTTMTKIMLDSMLGNRDLPEHLKTVAVQHGLDHSAAVVMAQEFVQQVVETSLQDAMLPDFAREIISHAIESQIDWRFIGERMLVSPEEN